MDDIDKETLRKYRQIYEIRNDGHVWNILDDKSFLEKLVDYRKDRKSGVEIWKGIWWEISRKIIRIKKCEENGIIREVSDNGVEYGTEQIGLKDPRTRLIKWISKR